MPTVLYIYSMTGHTHGGPLTTAQAFDQLINERGVYKKLEMNESTVRSIRKVWREGRLSMEKQYELLEKGGYRMVQEPVWKKTKSESDET